MFGNRNLPPLKIRVEQDSQYNIENYIVNYNYLNITKALGCNNAIKFEKFRIRTFILFLILCLTPLITALVLDLINFGFVGTTLWIILFDVSLVLWAIGILTTLLAPKLFLSTVVNRKFLLYFNVFDDLMKQGYINNNIYLYPETIQMATYYNNKLAWNGYEHYTSGFIRWSYWAATWGLCIFIDRLNSNNIVSQQ